jgi:tRNA (guanine37-N1)-methyltransferase
MFVGPFDASIVKRAREAKLVTINIHNLRDFAKDKHKTVDERPYGGGKGMVIRVDVVDRAIQDLKAQKSKPKTKTQNFKIILLSPQGKVFEQKKAKSLTKSDHLILIAGHYEGFDERIREHLVDEEISIGDYILTGGELPAMVVVDSVVRLLPGVLDEETSKNESFSQLTTDNSQLSALLDYPQYTRPEVYKKWKVPEILLSGYHKEIEKWRTAQALIATKKKRPDLLL